MLVVLDTNVLVAALRNPAGASGWWVRRGIETGTTIVSVPLMVEYEAVTTREALLKETGLTLAEVEATIGAFCAASRQVSASYSWRPLLRDPDDDMVLEAALVGQARVIVTFNRRDFVGAERYGVWALRPADAMETSYD